jgi:putative transposase
VFVNHQDYEYYLNNLLEWKSELGVQLFAYCLMTNHVHLVLYPTREPGDISTLMKNIASRQTRRINRLEKRSGTLWESRFRSSPIQTDVYLMACTRYVELNPVRAGMASSPADYPWSSFLDKVGSSSSALTDFDPCYLALADTKARRQQKYRNFVDSGAPTPELDRIRCALQRGQLTGNNCFIDEVEERLGRRIGDKARDRPYRAAIK